MQVLKAGHSYKLDTLDGEADVYLDFVNRGHGCDTPGTTNQEVLRVLIDRVKFLNEELPWEGNAEILEHLRAALLMHEIRHFERSVEKMGIPIEYVPTHENNGHFAVRT